MSESVVHSMRRACTLRLLGTSTLPLADYTIGLSK